MKAVIRCRKTKNYLQDEGEWTHDRLNARDFAHGPEAIQFALRQRLEDVEVVLTFEDPLYNIALSVRAP